MQVKRTGRLASQLRDAFVSYHRATQAGYASSKSAPWCGMVMVRLLKQKRVVGWDRVGGTGMAVIGRTLFGLNNIETAVSSLSA